MVIVEFALITILRGKFGFYLSPMLLFISSMAIGIIPLINQNKKIFLAENSSKTNYWLGITFISILSISLIYLLNKQFINHPINVKWSDIIPTIQVMVQHFIDGAYPYQTFNDFGYILKPSYLPLHWLPFVPAELYNFDYRWVSFSVFILSISIIIIQKNKVSILHFVLIFFLTLISIKYTNTFKLTIEPLIIGYYLFLGYALLKSKLNWISLGMGILICLLSRFSVIIWLPILFVVLLQKDKKLLIKTASFVLISVVLIYIIPFLSNDLTTLTNHFGKAIDEWYPKAWSKDGKPFALFNGVGFASYFYSILPFETPIKAKVTQYVHILASLSTTVILIVFYLKSKMTDNQIRIFLICSLKDRKSVV